MLSSTQAAQLASVVNVNPQQHFTSEATYEVIVLGNSALAASIFFNLSAVTSNICLIHNKNVANQVFSPTEGLVYCFHPEKAWMERTSDSWSYYKKFAQHTGVECPFITTGFLFFPKARHINAAKQIAENAEKIPMCWMDIDKLQMHFGALLNSNLYGAVYEPLSGYVDPQAVAKAWIQAGLNNGGHILQSNAVQEISFKNNKLEGLLTAEGKVKAQRIIIASDLNTPTVLDKLQIKHEMQLQTFCVDSRLPASPIHNHPAYLDECNQISGRPDLQTNNIYIQYPEDLGSACGAERWRWVKSSRLMKTHKILNYLTPDNNELVANTHKENIYVATCPAGLEVRIAPWIGQKIASIINTN